MPRATALDWANRVDKALVDSYLGQAIGWDTATGWMNVVERKQPGYMPPANRRVTSSSAARPIFIISSSPRGENCAAAACGRKGREGGATAGCAAAAATPRSACTHLIERVERLPKLVELRLRELVDHGARVLTRAARLLGDLGSL